MTKIGLKHSFSIKSRSSWIRPPSAYSGLLSGPARQGRALPGLARQARPGLIKPILKKLYNGESLVIIFKKIKLNNNFELAEIFYDIHVVSNYLLISLITIHILAVITHKLFFGDNILKKML